MERNEKIKKITLIDADSVLYYAGWSVKDTRNKELGIASLNSYIYRILKDTEATHYIGFVQTKSMNFRYQIYKDYKAKRPEREEWFAFWKPIFIETLYKQWKFVDPTQFNVESDDCMQATFSVLSQIYDPVEEITLAYIDKDLNNIYADHASAHIYYNYSAKNRGWFRVRRDRSILFFWRQMIIGDSADNLPGIFGKGKAFAAKILAPNEDNPRAMFFTVYREYLKHYKLEGREMFNQMRKCMILRDEIDGYEVPEPTKVPNLDEKLKAELLNI